MLSPVNLTLKCVAITSNSLQRSQKSQRVTGVMQALRSSVFRVGKQRPDLITGKQMLETCPSSLTQRHPTGFCQAVCYQTWLPGAADNTKMLAVIGDDSRIMFAECMKTTYSQDSLKTTA